MFGAAIVAEGQPVVLDEHCIVMENAVIRSTDEPPATIGKHCRIGPHTHIVGCALESPASNQSTLSSLPMLTPLVLKI
jgi:gamma-carbonic anhydrase